jgi:hypothetical protein
MGSVAFHIFTHKKGLDRQQPENDAFQINFKKFSATSGKFERFVSEVHFWISPTVDFDRKKRDIKTKRNEG